MVLKRQIYTSRPWDRDFEDALKLKTSTVPSPTYYNEKDPGYFCNDTLPTSGVLLTDRNVLEKTNLTRTKNQVQDILQCIKSRFTISCVVSTIVPIRRMLVTVFLWQILKVVVAFLNHWFLKHFILVNWNATFQMSSCHLSCFVSSLLKYLVCLTLIFFILLARCFFFNDNKKNYLKFPFCSNESYDWLFPKHGRLASTQKFFWVPIAFQFKGVSLISRVTKKMLLFYLTFTAVTALELTMNPFVYDKLEYINATFLAVVTLTRPFSLQWRSPSGQQEPRPFEAAFILVLFLVLPFSLLTQKFFLWGFPFKFFNLMHFLPNLLIFFLKQSRGTFSNSWLTPFFDIIYRFMLLVFTNVIYLRTLDSHDKQVSFIPSLTFFKSSDHFITLLNEKTYTCQFLSTLKMSLFSNDCPNNFPKPFQLCLLPEQQQQHGLEVNHNLKNLEIPLNTESTKNGAKVFIEDVTNKGSILSLHSTNQQKTRTNTIISRQFRLHATSRATLPLEKSCHFSLRHLCCSWTPGIQQSIRFVIKNLARMKHASHLYSKGILSACFTWVIPSYIISFLHHATLYEGNKTFFHFMLQPSPMKAMESDSTFFSSHPLDCKKTSCCCSAGVVLNYWVYAVMLHDSSNIWDLYASQGIATIDALYHCCCSIKMLSDVYENTTTRQNNETTSRTLPYMMPLELFVHLEKAYIFLQLNYADSYQDLHLDSILRICSLIRCTATSSEKKNDHPSNLNNCSIDEDYMTRCSKTEFFSLISESASIADLLISLGLPFCNGFRQWCHIAKLFDKKSRVLFSLEKMVLLRKKFKKNAMINSFTLALLPESYRCRYVEFFNVIECNSVCFYSEYESTH